MSDVEIAHKLIRLDSQTKPRHEEPINENVLEESSPLIKILLELRTHYSMHENKFGIDLVSTLENNSNVDWIYELITSNVESWKQNKSLKGDLFLKFGELIENNDKI